MESSAEKIWDLEDYVNTYIPEPHRYWILHQRGYADIFDWVGPDRKLAKQQKEQGIVDNWVTSLHRDKCPYVSIGSREPPLPDCVLTDNAGRKTGVEVTELVDQQMIEENKYASYHWKEYSSAELFSAVAKRLLGKNRRLERNSAAIQAAGLSKIVVILHCDEPDLRARPHFCQRVFAEHKWPELSEIDEGFLLLPCPRKTTLNDVEADYCQVVRIPIPAKISK